MPVGVHPQRDGAMPHDRLDGLGAEDNALAGFDFPCRSVASFRVADRNQSHSSGRSIRRSRRRIRAGQGGGCCQREEQKHRFHGIVLRKSCVGKDLRKNILCRLAMTEPLSLAQAFTPGEFGGDPIFYRSGFSPPLKGRKRRYYVTFGSQAFTPHGYPHFLPSASAPRRHKCSL